MSFLNTLSAIENATTKYSSNYISTAIRTIGTRCILFRKNKDRVTDKVYGIYGGSDLSRTPSTSIYDKPITYENIDDIDILDHDLGNPTNYDLMESIDDSWEELIKVDVLLNTMTWRAISNQSSSLLEDPGYIYCRSETPIEHGDLLMVDSKTHQLKFKVYFPELIGNERFMLYRFKITNVQE